MRSTADLCTFYVTSCLIEHRKTACEFCFKFECTFHSLRPNLQKILNILHTGRNGQNDKVYVLPSYVGTVFTVCTNKFCTILMSVSVWVWTNIPIKTECFFIWVLRIITIHFGRTHVALILHSLVYIVFHTMLLRYWTICETGTVEERNRVFFKYPYNINGTDSLTLKNMLEMAAASAATAVHYALIEWKTLIHRADLCIYASDGVDF